MFVNVVDLDPAAPRRAVMREATQGFSGVDSVLYVPVPSGVDAQQLDHFIADETEPRVLRSDVTVLALPPELDLQVAEDPTVLEDVSRRIEGAPLYIVHHEQLRPRLKHALNDDVASISSAEAEFVREMCQADVATVIRRAGAELPPHEGLHYEGPNGKHYSAFLRVGLALRSTAELDRVAFWLAPVLASCDGLVVDHWALVSLAYRTADYVERLGAQTPHMRIEAARSYNEPVETLSRRLELAFGEAKRLGIVISVNSTGGLVRRITTAAEQAGYQVEPVAVCEASTAVHAIPALATLDESFTGYEVNECVNCRTGASVVVPVERDTYLLSLAAYVRIDAIRRVDAAAAREFMERYAGTGVANLHRDHDDDRHHAFYIDVSRLIDTPAFHPRLVETLDECVRRGIEIVICPPHEAAAQLGKLVAERLGVSCIVVDERRLDQLDASERDIIVGSERICLVDDVVITGGRLSGYRNLLVRYRKRYESSAIFELFCVVGVARPPDEATLRGISDITHHSPTHRRFLPVETLLLPNWNSASECPWCDELRLLFELPPNIRSLTIVEQRIDRLVDRQGLVDDPFLPSADAPIGAPRDAGEWDSHVVDQPSTYAGEYWELNAGSVFGNVQGADLVLSVAAALQQLRNRPRMANGGWGESRLDEFFRSPIAKVLDPALYLTGRFYEPVLVASILRAVHRHDVRAPMEEHRLIRAVHQQLLRSPSSIGLHSELILAMARGILPKVPMDFDTPEDNDLRMLHQALHEQSTRLSGS